jgi:glycosyltransferase A (GT-A) superfamily protein (DUF2064 family)
LLFARGASEEARAKRIGSAAVFALARRRIERISRVVGATLVVAEQRGATFGERLTNAFGDAAARYDEVVVVPTDVPQLTARDVLRAFALLRSHEIVLGPCPDGGVYLIGGRADARLADVRWLTPHVLEDLNRGNAALLDPLIDVDCADDLAHLAGSVPASFLAPPPHSPFTRTRTNVVLSPAISRGPPVECGGHAAALPAL